MCSVRAHKIPTRVADSPGELDGFANGLYPGCAAKQTRHNGAHNLVAGKRGVTPGAAVFSFSCPWVTLSICSSGWHLLGN